jgi:carboxypeptidase family protein
MLLRTVLGGILAVSGLSASQEGAGFFGRVSEGTVPVAGAIVTISNRGFVKSVTTNGNGRFALEPIPAGQYDLRTSVSGYAVFECSVIVHSDDSHRNWIDVKGLLPADQQTVSVVDLAARKQARPLAGLLDRVSRLRRGFTKRRPASATIASAAAAIHPIGRSSLPSRDSDAAVWNGFGLP